MMFGVADIETTGVESDCIILSAGFVVEELTKRKSLQELVYAGYSCKMSVREQRREGRYIDPDTMAWWKKQSPEAQEILRPLPTDRTMQEFTDELGEWFKTRGIKSRDIPFSTRGWLDFSALTHMWKRQLGISMDDLLVPHWNVEEVRTCLKYLGQDRYGSMQPDEVEGFIHHSAIHDAALDWLRIQNALVETGAIEIGGSK